MKEIRQSLLKKLFAALCACCALTVFFSCKTDAEQATTITEFVFSATRNGSLEKDAVGTVNQQTKIITVKLPSSVYKNATARSVLRADITCASGSALIDEESTFNYANSPVPITVANTNGNTVMYLVSMEQQYDAVQKGALLFTEYYSGSKYSFKGTNNQYVEITNMSLESVELGGVELNLHAWKNGQRVPERDQSVQLLGTLAAGASTVIYSGRTTFSSLVSKGTSDALLNSVISLNGQDALTLTSGGVVLDVLGPNDGNGSGWSWGNAKLMQRKHIVTRYDGWNEEEWITYQATNSADDAANAGVATPAVSGTANDITYFAFEGLEETIYGDIDASAKTITLNVKEKYGTTHKLTVSSNGTAVRLSDMTRVVSGQTEIDFSKPVTLLSFNVNGEPATYSVVFNQIKETKYTRTNYDFDGNIQAVLDKIEAGETAINMDVTGILTCKDVYGYKTAQHCFFLQDKNAGMYFYIGDSASVKLPDGAVVGNKITVRVTEAKKYYDMPEVTGMASCEIVDSSVAAIYYEDDIYSQKNCLGKVYEYIGTIENEPNNNIVGTFSESEELYFHSSSALKSKLQKGMYGRFYGPISYSYSQYRMEITDENQIKSE